jgi:hypothetical protein
MQNKIVTAVCASVILVLMAILFWLICDSIAEHMCAKRSHANTTKEVSP